MFYRYYSKFRPISIGTYPKNDYYINHCNFNERHMCEDIQDYAWGFLEYSKPLTPEEIINYDLIDANKKWFYGVMAITNNETLKTIVKKYKNEYATTKPDQLVAHGKYHDRIVYWFESEEEAENMIKEYSN